MYTICKDFLFAAAHFVRGHTGGCENLHGHNYRVRVFVASERLDELGMVMDFADLKRLMEVVLGKFDHQVINDIPPFDVRNTTAELFASFVHAELEPQLPEGVQLERVEVWENDTSCATYRK
ncbi:MAG: 6-carboxytetrahydropterin synthase QueD [Thermoanaerobaculia bacterium]|nr:6-carboxytetrahydropterin synthase QueD [Thermoanaerobaculia bacterium]